MLEIQKFLQQVGDIEVGNMLLQEQLGIIVTKHYYNGEYLYHYTHFDDNDIKHKIIEECNLLVLDKDGKIVSKAFDRIYDIYDPIGHKYDTFIDARAELQEQGMLVVLNNYKDKLLLVTKKGVDGKECVDTNRHLDTAMSLFLYNKFKAAQPLSKFYDGFSYVCLFITPKANTPYKYPDLLLLTVIDKHTGNEMSREFVDAYAKGNDFSRPLNGPIDCVDKILISAAHGLAISKGIILADRDGRRVVARNKSQLDIVVKDANSSILLDKFATAVLTKKHRRVLLNFPECKDMLLLLNKTLTSAKVRLNNQWGSLDGLPVEEFTRRVETHPLKAVLQRRRLGKMFSFNNIADHISSQKLLKLAAIYFSREYEKVYDTLTNEVGR
jgi:hypothetical protein